MHFRTQVYLQSQKKIRFIKNDNIMEVAGQVCGQPQAQLGGSLAMDGGQTDAAVSADADFMERQALLDAVLVSSSYRFPSTATKP